jgi:hypothetical protein
MNDVCAYSYRVSENELKENPNIHSHCFLCGSQIKVAKESLEEIVMLDLYKRAEEYINRWMQELGAEGCIELVERNKNLAVYRIYKDILERRGFRLK